MSTLAVPPIVGQNVALLPDGNIDRAHSTDCGEACVASAFQALRHMPISPGCVRQMLALPEDSGNTMPEELAGWLGAVGCDSTVKAWRPQELLAQLMRLRHYGEYMILLGQWIEPAVGHWVLAYETDGSGTWVMEPWTATYRHYSHEYLLQNSWNAQVIVTELTNASRALRAMIHDELRRRSS